MDREAPKTTREAILNALRDIKKFSPAKFSIFEQAEIIEQHIRERHANDAAISELKGEGPIKLFSRMYPKRRSSNENL